MARYTDGMRWTSPARRCARSPSAPASIRPRSRTSSWAASARSASRASTSVATRRWRQRAGGRGQPRTDKGIRPETTTDKLGAPKPAFKPEGVIPAGNSSQITDGAAAVLVMEKQKARALGLRPRARFHSFALGGVDPVIMLTGVIPATTRILARSGLGMRDFAAIEINDAFAPVVLAWAHEFAPHMAVASPC